jgi:hypothetical protein
MVIRSLRRWAVITSRDAAGVRGTHSRAVPPMAAALSTSAVRADGTVPGHYRPVGAVMRARMPDVLVTGRVPAPFGLDVPSAAGELRASPRRAGYEHRMYFEGATSALPQCLPEPQPIMS